MSEREVPCHLEFLYYSPDPACIAVELSPNQHLFLSVNGSADKLQGKQLRCLIGNPRDDGSCSVRVLDEGGSLLLERETPMYAARGNGDGKDFARVPELPGEIARNTTPR